MYDSIDIIKLDIISKCNFNCRFCSRPVIANKNGIMSIQDIDALIRKFINMKIPFVDLTPISGEIFCHPNIYEILERIKNHYKNCFFEFITNLSIDTKKILVTIKDIPNLRLYVSMYGKNYEEFSYITRSGKTREWYDSFCNTIREVGMLKNITYNLRTLDNNDPIHNLEINGIPLSRFQSEFSCRTGGKSYGDKCPLFGHPICVTWDKKIIACGCTRPKEHEHEFILGNVDIYNKEVKFLKNSNFFKCTKQYMEYGLSSFNFCKGCIRCSEEDYSNLKLNLFPWKRLFLS